MRIRNWLALLLVSLASCAPDAYAQCPTLYDSFRQLRGQTNELTSRRIGQATELQKRWLACRQPLDSTYVSLLLLIGDLYRQEENYPAATQQYQQATNLALGSPSLTKLRARVQYLLGASYLYANRSEAARSAFLAVLKLVKSKSDKTWGVLAHINLAHLNIEKGDYEQALAHTELGQAWIRGLDDESLTAQLWREKAYALRLLGRYDEAKVYAQETIRLATKAHEIDLGQYYLLLGDIENKRGQVESAVKAYQTALMYCRLAKDIPQQAVVLTNLGFLFYTQHDYTQALRYAEEALTLQKNPFSRAILFDIIASCYWKKGQYDRSLAGYQQGLQAMPFNFRETNVTSNPPAKVMRLVARKSVLLTLIQDKADTWLDYAKATNSRQNFRYALDTYQKADEMIDYMRWEHTGQQSKLFWRKKTRGMYERAIEACLRLGDTEQAFQFIEKSRAVMLADKLNELGARQQLTPSQINDENRLRQSVNELQDSLANSSPGKAYDALRAALFTRQDSLDGFLKQLEVTNPAYYRYKYDNGVPALSELRNYLSVRKATFVTYFLGDSALYVLAISGQRDTLIRQPVGVFAPAARAFLGLLADPDSMNRQAAVSRFLKLGHTLYGQLFAPLKLSARRIIVSPDGAFVPFEALSRSTSLPEYLVKAHAFSYVYSARLLLKNPVHSDRSMPLSGPAFLGVAPVSFAPALGQASLPGSDNALQSIADRFGSANLLTNTAATRGAFLSKAPTAQVVHLFTHAQADDSTGQDPRLYFADSTLQLSELSKAGLLNTDMVVLAACKTGVGTNQRGEGVFSMARGFAALGVPSVLTTLWSVENKATYDITNLFYEYLADGLPKDEALQRAQCDWLDNATGADQLPTYWAGLIMVGDTEPLAGPNRWPWVAGIVLVLSGIAGLWWRRKQRQSTRIASSRQPV